MNMKYKVGKYEFASSREYEAAKRDVAKARGMERRGKTSPEIALHYLRQIRAEKITFETDVGKDFERTAKEIVYVAAKKRPGRTYMEERYVVSKAKKQFRDMLLLQLQLYLAFASVVAAIGVVGYQEHRSRKQLEELRRNVHIKAQQPVVAPLGTQEAAGHTGEG